MNLRSLFLSLLFSVTLLGAARPVAAKQDFVYIHDRGNPSQVFAYQLSKQGQLAPVSGSPFQTSAGNTNFSNFYRGDCGTAAYSSKLKVLWVTGTTGISALRVGTNGSLSEVAGSPFGPAGDYVGLAVLQQGAKTWVYATQPSQDRIRAFQASADGSLTEIAASPFACGDLPITLAIAKGKLFTIARLDAEVNSFTIQKSGALTRGPDTELPPVQSLRVYADPAGKTLSIPEIIGADGVLVYKIEKSGGLTPLAGSPFGADTDTTSGLVFGTPLLFAMSFFTEVELDLQVYRRTKKGSLTKLQPQSSGLEGTRCGALKKSRLVLASDASNAFRTYQVAKDGTLSVIDTETVETQGFLTQLLIVTR